MTASFANIDDYFLTGIYNGKSFSIKKTTVDLYVEEPYLYFRWFEFKSSPILRNEWKVDFNDITITGAGVVSATDAETKLEAILYTPNLTTDGTLASDSDLKYPSEKAIRTYIAANALSTVLASGNIFVGSVGNVATAVPMSGEATLANTGAITLSTSAVTGKVLTGLSVTGTTIVGTDTILQAFGKTQNQINALVGGVTYQGTWNANTNSPALATGVGTKGYYYVVSVPGATSLDGITDWKLGDWAIFNGTAWEKVDNTDAVISVFGRTGAVIAAAADYSGIAMAGVTSFNGLIVTANTGVITTGTWNGTILTGQYGGTGVANTGKIITLAGNLTTTGAFNTTFAQQFTGTVTLPPSTSVLAASTVALTAGGLPYIAATGLLAYSSNLLWDNTNLNLTEGDIGGTSKKLKLYVGNSTDTMYIGDNTASAELGIFYYGATSGGSLFTEVGIVLDQVNQIYLIGNIVSDYIAVQVGSGTFLSSATQAGLLTTSYGVQVTESSGLYQFLHAGNPDILNLTATAMTFSEALNIVVGTSTGTKIGTATSQKLSFWNKTPIVQPTTSISGVSFTANTGTTVNTGSTFGGYTLAKVVAALVNTGILA